MEMGDKGVASADPFEECRAWSDHKSEEEEEEASSNFSSCEESEFDRYCSANSVLGSASVCSSVGNRSEFLDSLRSFGHGEDCLSEGSGVGDRVWRNRRRGDGASLGRFDGLSDGEGESAGGGDDVAQLRFAVGGSDVPPRRRTGSELFPGSTANHGEDRGFSKKLEFCTQGSTSGGQLRTESVPDQDSSSGYEHSEDEDSMLDYGTDAEDGVHVNKNGNFHHNWQDKPVNQNPLLISTSVAFGNDDWEDFVRETEVNALDAVPLCGEKDSKPQDDLFEMEDNILELPDAARMHHFGSEKVKQEDARDIPEASYQVLPDDRSTEKLIGSLVRNPVLDKEAVTVQRPVVSMEDSGFPVVYAVKTDQDAEKEVPCMSHGKFVNANRDETAKGLLYAKSEHSLISHHDNFASQFYSPSMKESQGKGIRPLEECKIADFLPTVQKGHEFANVDDTNVAANQVEKQNTAELYDEMVLEMEEILLDSGGSHGSRLLHGSQGCMFHKSNHIRDGSSTASTSGTDDVYMGSQFPLSIDWIEVVGAKQKKGDVSFGERLVGVKEYTIYKLRVQSGKDRWEVDRRYRDFVTLYRQLKALFSDHGLLLPSPWTNVERESRNIFGNASPNVISQRSVLIQDCLRSVLHFRFPSGTPSPLIWFLSPSPSKDSGSSGFLSPLYHSLQKVSADANSNSSYCEESRAEEVSTLGKTISLVVEVRLYKSVRQLLEAQRYMCAGCHRQLDVGKTMMQELVKTFGWGKPRLCEYTGQLFCLTCHTNDTAVLPARVLHHWDFSRYPVSQLAKAYLDSIYDQPMLCVSAVNPFLFSKVPALLHIMGIRRKIVSMLPYVRCPFRRSIHRGLGSRRYLLENNEFFALRDLVDLSKGAFAALPTLVKTVESKILDHIAQQCLICYDSGVSCAARQACKDPSSLIFPFQEAEAVRCSSCHLLFHQPCIAKMGNCPCGKLAPVDGKLPAERGGRGADIELDGFVDTPTQNSDAKTLAGFFSDLVSKASAEKLWKPRKNDPVILMGSLPGTIG